MIIGTFFGVLTIGLINNMMTLVGVPPFLVNAMKGTIIILAVLLQKKMQNKHLRKKDGKYENRNKYAFMDVQCKLIKT